MDILNQYTVAAVMAACVAIGAVIKHSLGFIPNRYIPLILGVLGVLLNAWSSGRLDLTVLLGGLASGLSATGAFEMFRNLFAKGGGTNE